MDSRHLETFHAVLRHGTLIAAGRALQCAQSTITTRIQELERELGVQLFRRNGRRVILTEAGEAVAARTTQIADAVVALKDLTSTYRTGSAGKVRMAAIEPTATQRLPSIVATFYRQRPSLELTLEVGGSDRVASYVAHGDVDFGLASPPPEELALDFEPWFSEPLAVIAPAKHPLGRAARITAKDLRRDDLLLTDKSCAYRLLIERNLHALGVRTSHPVEIGSFGVLLRLVAEGSGVAIVPVCGTLPLPKGTVLRQLHGLKLALPVGLIARRATHQMSPVQQQVIAFLRLRLADRRGRPAVVA